MGKATTAITQPGERAWGDSHDLPWEIAGRVMRGWVGEGENALWEFGRKMVIASVFSDP